MFTFNHRENPGEGDNYFVDVYRFEKDFKEEDLHLQTEETAGYKIATADEIKALADEGIFLHYDSIKRVFEEQKNELAYSASSSHFSYKVSSSASISARSFASS